MLDGPIPLNEGVWRFPVISSSWGTTTVSFTHHPAETGYNPTSEIGDPEPEKTLYDHLSDEEW